MVRKKIELKQGSIVPVTRGVWYAAAEKLAEAKGGIKIMHKARNRIEFEHGWVTFTDSLEEFWTRFYAEGKEKFSAMSWRI